MLIYQRVSLFRKCKKARMHWIRRVDWTWNMDASWSCTERHKPLFIRIRCHWSTRRNCTMRRLYHFHKTFERSTLPGSGLRRRKHVISFSALAKSWSSPKSVKTISAHLGLLKTWVHPIIPLWINMLTWHVWIIFGCTIPIYTHP